MRKILILAPVIVLIFIGCEGEPTGKMTAQSYKDVCEGYDIADKEMLRLIAKIKEERISNDKFTQRFRDEQIYWIQYRDRHMRALYPEDWDLHYRKNYGKQVFNSCKCQELIRMTENRIFELKMYLEGGPSDQGDCPSSWNEKSDQ